MRATLNEYNFVGIYNKKEKLRGVMPLENFRARFGHKIADELKQTLEVKTELHDVKEQLEIPFEENL